MRWINAGAVLAVIVFGTSCGEPTEPTPPSGSGQPGVAVQITAEPLTLQVNEMVLLVVKATDRNGLTAQFPAAVVFSSSDPAVATVSSSGVVRGIRRGTANIRLTSGKLSNTVSVRVTARLEIAVDKVEGQQYSFFVAVGDTVQLKAIYADVNGYETTEVPSVTWRSQKPSVMTVDADGRAVAIAADSSVLIIATTSQETASTYVRVVANNPAPAMVRLAHAAKGLGPVQFLFNKGAPVTLRFGESVELMVPQGMFIATTLGIPPASFSNPSTASFASGLYSGDRLTLYVAGEADHASLVTAWGDTASADSAHGRVRLVQGYNPFGIVFLRDSGASADGNPELCYFDPWTVSDYFTRSPGPFDMLLIAKYSPTPGSVRLKSEVASGKSITVVLTGSSPADAGYLLFTDR